MLFLIDVVLNFFTTYINDNGDEIMDMKKIAKNYLKVNFWLDLFASLPADNIFVLMNPDSGSHTEIL